MLTKPAVASFNIWGLWTWKRLIQASGLLSVWFPFLTLYALVAILQYSLSHIRPPEPLIAHLQGPLWPKVSRLIIHFSQNVHHFVNWYYQSIFEHQERSFKVEVYMTLLGEVPVTYQGRIALLSDVDAGQPCRTSWRGHQGRKRSKNAREGIRDKMVLSFGMNDGDTWEEVGQESSLAKLLSTQVGLWEKVL